MSSQSEIVIYSDALDVSLEKVREVFDTHYHFQWLERPPSFELKDVVRSKFGESSPTGDEILICQLLWKLSIDHSCWIHYYNFQDLFNPFVLNYVDVENFELDDAEDEYVFWLHNGKLYKTAGGLSAAIEQIQKNTVAEVISFDPMSELGKDKSYLAGIHDIEVNLPLRVINMFYHHPWTINESLEYSDSHGKAPSDPTYKVKLGVNGDQYTRLPSEALSQALINGYYNQAKRFPAGVATGDECLSYDLSRVRFQNELIDRNVLTTIIEPERGEELDEQKYADNLVKAFEQAFDEDDLEDEYEAIKEQVKNMDLSDDFLEYVWKHELQKPETDLQKHVINNKRPMKEYNDDSDYTSDEGGN